MLAARNSENLPEVNFKEKVRCGEVYRNLNGNEMFQKFYYRCLECSLDFESSPEFEEHVIAHYLEEDEDPATIDNSKNTENVISISSDEEESDYLYAFEVASLVEENVSENDLPLPLMQMLSEQSTDSCDRTIQLNSESDEEDEKNVAFPCEGLRKQALHQYSEHCCTQCPAYFDTKSELIFHLQIHTIPNTVVCPHCYEAFPNILKLNEHLSLNKRKRIRRTKNKDNNLDILENCKKPKNQIQDDDLLPHDGKNDTNCTVHELKNDSTESFSNTKGNSENEAMISKINMSSSSNENCCKDNINLNSRVREKNITNDT